MYIMQKKLWNTVCTLMAIVLTAGAQTVDEGKKLFEYERYRSAIEVLKKTVMANPQDVNGWYWLTRSQLAAGYKDSAESSIQQMPADIKTQPLGKVIQGAFLLQKEDSLASLQLFMEAIGVGPYKTALNKRGVGLHHIALDVLNIDKFVNNLVGSGWLLHPKSLEFYNTYKQVYLCRTNLPMIIEIQQKKELIDVNRFVLGMEFPFGELRLLNSLSCESLKMGEKLIISTDERSFSIKDLI